MPPKRKYRTKKGDSYASLNQYAPPQDLMNLNPGVPTLSPGQDIWVPATINNPNSIYGANNTLPPAPTNFSTANSFGGWTPQLAAQQNAALSPSNGLSLYQQSERTQTPINPVTGGVNSFQSGTQVNNQPGLQVLLNGSVAQSGGGGGGAPTSVALPPNYVYTGGNDPLSVEQRRLWNIAAGGTGNERVFLMSRDQKRAIGDAKRRRRMRGNNEAAQSVVAVPEVPTTQGNMVNSALSWRVG